METMGKINLAQSVMLPLSKIESNKGQIEGLPKNPRLIRDGKFEILKKSIQDDPEMTALRELLVVEHNGKYVIIGGNMRFRAMQDLGIKEAPCKIIPADTDVEKLKAYTIKDNAGFGEWDWDDLANEWCDAPLSDWGVDVWEAQGEDVNIELKPARSLESLIAEGSNEFSITFVFDKEHKDIIEDYIKVEGKDVLTYKIIEVCRKLQAK
jgi:hypothetical protein